LRQRARAGNRQTKSDRHREARRPVQTGSGLGKKRQAESTRGERVISSPPNDLWRICRDGMPARMTASINARLPKEKEKICIAMFSPNGMQQASRLHCGIARRLKIESIAAQK
jgi:glutamate-1-semialdehyde aminotransferase